MYAHTLGQFNYQNDINQDKAANALQAVMSGGQIVCKGGQTGCVPVDVFSANGPSAEGYAYIYAPTFTRNEQDIKVFNAFISGDLGEYGVTSPWADAGLAVVVGVESREENYDQKFDESQLAAARFVSRGIGAVIYFLGVVREQEGMSQITGIEYEAFTKMATHQFDKIFDQIASRWPVESVRVVHRIGLVQVNEPSLWVELTAPHRAEAFEACQFLIDEMKKVVPIWKRPRA